MHNLMKKKHTYLYSEGVVITPETWWTITPESMGTITPESMGTITPKNSRYVICENS